MIKTEYITRYSNLNKISEVYNYCSSLHLYYPNFDNWFSSKMLNGIFDGERIIILKRFNQELAGFAVLKNNSEKKICTLKVRTKFKGKGVGNELMYNSLELLRTEKPLITVSEKILKELLPLLQNYNFQLDKKLNSYYKKNEVEYCFNTGVSASEKKRYSAFYQTNLCKSNF